MRCLNLTLPTIAENCALDEALLQEAESSGTPREVLRLWEMREPSVVLGRSSQVDRDVHRDACDVAGVPIVRRSSGGAAIVCGPGCLMVSLVLSYERRPYLSPIDQAHQFVLQRHQAAIRPLAPGITIEGVSDLAVGGRKFSGNSMRCARDHVLYHGTLLYDFRLEMIDQLLTHPPREPDYRGHRPHAMFVTNLPIAGERLRFALMTAWNTEPPDNDWPQAIVEQLVTERYGQDTWSFRH
jgi:lipoate-protein ligase A